MKPVFQRRFERGEERFGRELDIATFIRRQRRQFFAFKAIFSKMERYLIHHNKFFVLEGNCTHSDSDSDGIPDDWA